MLSDAVALRIPRGETLAVGREPGDPDPLHGRGDDRVAVEELGALAAEEFVAGGDVVPAHDHRAVEALRVGRAVHEDAGPERHRSGRLGLPAPVATPLAAGHLPVRRGVAGEEELLLDVAVIGEIEQRSTERPAVRPAGDRPLDRRRLVVFVVLLIVVPLRRGCGSRSPSQHAAASILQPLTRVAIRSSTARVTRQAREVSSEPVERSIEVGPGDARCRSRPSRTRAAHRARRRGRSSTPAASSASAYARFSS